MTCVAVLFAAVRVLTALGSAVECRETVAAGETEVFERAGRLVSAQNGRRAKWERYLDLMGLRESRPSLSAVRYQMSVGRRVYSFTVYGRLFIDVRFVRDDEMPDVLALERIFRGHLARSPWKGDALRDAREEPLALCGYEDERFGRLDAAVLRVVSDFNGTRPEHVHELSPRLFKAYVVEETYWRGGDVTEGWLRAALSRLAKAGERRGGGAFCGWYVALQNAKDADFAERVAARSGHPEIFVPARAWKEKSR